MTYFTYILRCAGGELYTGITTDLRRRFAEHCGAGRGAKYTAVHPPVRYEAAWQTEGRSAASRLESRIKAMKREEKERLIRDEAPFPLEPSLYQRAPLPGGTENLP